MEVFFVCFFWTKMAACRLLEKGHLISLLKTVDNFIFDCDGVLWNGTVPIAGAKEIVAKLTKMGKGVFFVSNNSSKTRKEYTDKCVKMGFAVKEDQIACTSYAAAHYLHSIGFQSKVYLVGGKALADELTKFKISFIGCGPDPFSGELQDWLKIRLDPEVKCVLVGFDPHISFMKIMKAASYIKNPNCLFIATNEDNNLPYDSDIVIPGTGTIVAPIKLASNREPVVIGKPSRNMLDLLKHKYGIEEERSLMIGDRLSTDIAMAYACNMQPVLVLTGVSTVNDAHDYVRNLTSEQPSLLYANSVADILKYL